MACTKAASGSSKQATVGDQMLKKFEDDLKKYLSKCTLLNADLEPFMIQRKEDLNAMKKEGHELWRSVLRAKKDVEVLVSRLNHSNCNNEAIKDQAALINSIKHQIRTLKLSQADVICHLGKEEEELYQEILERHKWFHSWKEWKHAAGDFPEKCAIKPNNNGTKTATRNLPPEVKEFEDFLFANGGHTGGWKDFEHNLFIRERNRIQNPAAFFKSVARQIFGRTEEDVEQHENWYREYTEKKERKKFAIFNWKAEKEKEERQRFMQKQEERIAERILRSEELRKSKAIRATQLEMIAAWKLKKHQEKEEDMKQKEKLIEEEKQKEAKKKMEQEEIRKRVKEYQDQKRKVGKKDEPPATSIENPKYTMKYFQEKDMLKLQEKEEKMKAMKEEKWKQKLQLENLKRKVAVSAKRDPNRLLQSTAAWKERLETKDEPHQNSPVFINNTSSRATPKWRKGLHN